MTQNQLIHSLHQQYINESGLNIPLPVSQYWIWEAFIARGHTSADLRDVLKALKRGIGKQERRPGCLRFSTLIGDLEHFAEELALARRVVRPKPAYPVAKAQVLRATGRSDEPPSPPAQSAAAIIEGIKLADMLSAWRKQHL